jgi:hypothetical protein
MDDFLTSAECDALIALGTPGAWHRVDAIFVPLESMEELHIAYGFFSLSIRSMISHSPLFAQICVDRG